MLIDLKKLENGLETDEIRINYWKVRSELKIWPIWGDNQRLSKKRFLLDLIWDFIISRPVLLFVKCYFILLLIYAMSIKDLNLEEIISIEMEDGEVTEENEEVTEENEEVASDEEPAEEATNEEMEDEEVTEENEEVDEENEDE